MLNAKQLKELRARRVPHTGNRLASAFEIDGRSQMECSQSTGFTPQYITDVKSGRFQRITVENAHKFAEFFGCAIEDLFPAREALSA